MCRRVAAAISAGFLVACSSGEHPETSVLLGRHAERGVDVEVRLTRKAAPAVPVLCARFAPSRSGFHLYSTDLPNRGVNGIGRPTRLRLVRSSAARSLGPAIADKPSTPLTVVPLGLTFPVYPAGPVTLCMPVAIDASSDRSAEIAVTYMTCSDQVCMAPVEDRTILVSIDDPSSGRRVKQ